MFRAAGPPTQQSNTIECFSLIVSFKCSAPYQLIFAKILVLQGFLCACKRLLIRFSNLWCWQEGFSIHPIQTFFQIGSKNPEGGSKKFRKNNFSLLVLPYLHSSWNNMKGWVVVPWYFEFCILKCKKFKM